MLISLIFQITILLFQMYLNVCTWFVRRPFYLAGGTLLFAIAGVVGQSINPLLAFLIGIGVAMATEWLLSHYDLLYKQVVFSIVGMSAGVLLHIGLNSGPLPALILTGLCIWHAQHPNR